MKSGRFVSGLFFGLACLVAVLLFAGWGLYWSGFPQFSEVRLL